MKPTIAWSLSLSAAAGLVAVVYLATVPDIQQNPPGVPATVVHTELPSTASPSPSAAETRERNEGIANVLYRQTIDLEEQKKVLTDQNQELQTRLTDLLRWMVENYKGKYPLPTRHMADLQLDPVTKTFALNPDVADLLNMTYEEEKILGDVLAQTKNIINAIESELLTVESPNDDKVIVHIPSFPEEGAELRDDIYLAAEEALGTYRSQWFFDVTGEKLEESYSRFGEEERTMTFEILYEGNEYVPPQISIRDARITPHENEEGHVIVMDQKIVEAIPEAYELYLEVLPEHFLAFVQ